MARELAAEEELILLCGRYEGIDQRIIDTYVDEEISIGDYVLSSGEVSALVLIDTTYRLVDGVISAESLEEESFSDGLLEYPQYTRPEIYDKLRVPEVLLSGHHEQIRRWRLKKRVEKTLSVRQRKVTGRGVEDDRVVFFRRGTRHFFGHFLVCSDVIDTELAGLLSELSEHLVNGRDNVVSETFCHRDDQYLFLRCACAHHESNTSETSCKANQILGEFSFHDFC
jgi:hypothetical protein